MIFCIIGKSGTGKSTVFNKLKDILKDEKRLDFIVPATTRNKRGEEDTDYEFETPNNFRERENRGEFLEVRKYNTYNEGEVYYATPKIKDFTKHYIYVTTPDVMLKLCDYYGKRNVTPIQLMLSDYEIIKRKIDRIHKYDVPNKDYNTGYIEACRRFIKDSQDFAKYRGIGETFSSYDTTICSNSIKQFIEGVLNSIEVNY